jgi:hypothetical protein
MKEVACLSIAQLTSPVGSYLLSLELAAPCAHWPAGDQRQKGPSSAGFGRDGMGLAIEEA